MRTAVLLVLVCASVAWDGAAAARERLDRVVARTIRSNYGALHACFRRALAEDREAGGTLFVRVTLGRGDAVKAVSAERDELGHKRAVTCILDWVRAWTLRGAAAAGAGAGADITIPLTFRPVPRQFSVRLDDTRSIALGGRSSARVLLTGKNSGASRAGLSRLSVRGRIRLPARASEGGTRARLLYVLSGRGRVSAPLGGRTARLSAGGAAWAPADVALSCKGTMELLVVHVPAGGELLHGRRSARSARGAAGKGWPRPAAGRAWRKSRRMALRPLLRLRAASDGSSAYLGLIRAPTGASISEVHVSEAAVYYVVAGRGTVESGGAVREVGPEHALYLRGGQTHRIVAKGGRLEMVQIYAPAGPERRLLATPERRTRPR